MLDGDKFILPRLSVYLFFALHFGRRERKGVLDYIHLHIFGSAVFILLVEYIRARVPGFLFYFQDPPLDHGSVVVNMRNDA